MYFLVSAAGFLPLPLAGYGISLTFAASLCSSKSDSLAIALPHNLFLLYHHSCSAHRSRMTVRVNCVSSKFLLGFCKKQQKENRKQSPFASVFGTDDTKEIDLYFPLLFHVKRKGIILTENGILCILM